jgi:hypothetical protein
LLPRIYCSDSRLSPEKRESGRRAAREGMTMSDYVLNLLQRDLALPTQQEWLARLGERTSIETGDEVVAALADVRARRDVELRLR